MLCHNVCVCLCVCIVRVRQCTATLTSETGDFFFFSAQMDKTNFEKGLQTAVGAVRYLSNPFCGLC